MTDGLEQFKTRGWLNFAGDDRIEKWARHARPIAEACLADPANGHWFRHQHSWFVGVDTLPNDLTGRLKDGPPLEGMAIDFIRNALQFHGPWHKAQLSVCYPGYPQRDPSESDSQHAFRRNRDAAHVDGLRAIGPDRSRYFREFHRFILGIPLNDTDAGSSPLVVWEGSQIIMQKVFAEILSGVDISGWQDIDMTDAYHRTRKQVFESCRRVEVSAQPGETYIIHRFALHGVAPWRAGNVSPRMIAYFRPDQECDAEWLEGPNPPTGH